MIFDIFRHFRIFWHKDFRPSVRSFVRSSSVTPLLPPLKSETGWTGELWSNRVHDAIECASSRAPLLSLIRHFEWLQGYDQGSRKMGTVGTCSQPICDFGSHFWLASWKSFRNKYPTEMEVASQTGLKAPKRCIKTLVIGIISLKTQNICIFFF